VKRNWPLNFSVPFLFRQSEAGDDLPLLLKLFEQDLSHQMAGLDDLGIGDPIIDVDSFAPRQNDALRSQDAHVLGEIGLA